MEEKISSSISESMINKGILRDLWKMEEDLTKNEKQLKCLFLQQNRS